MKTACLLACLFVTLFAPAQLTDTVIDGGISDTAYIDNNNEPDDEESPVPEENPFMKKWMEGAGMDSIRLRHLPDSVVNALKQQEDFEYGTKTGNSSSGQSSSGGQYGNKTTTRERNSDSETSITPVKRNGLQIGLWAVIIAGFAIFLVIWLSGTLFRKKTKMISETETGEITEDIFAINYQKEIDKAAASGNYRLAIRLMFLRLLKNMSEKNIIRYKQDSTNLDYLMQLHASDHYHDFFRIARNYEYSWYGHFEVKEDAYKIIRSDFDSFDRKIR
ncbi:MAG TPA: hypothetical protein VF476_05135 [Chitinophagaceae bacterium]